MDIVLQRHEAPLWISQIAGSLSEVLHDLESSHANSFWSLTNTADELSLVSVIESHEAFGVSDGPWTLFGVKGPLDFGLTGILNSLTGPMAAAGISIFAVSTYDTDYILVKAEVADAAQAVWQSAGFEVEQR